MQKSLDDFVSLPPPNHNSKIGAATHSIDRTSQHLRLTQNLARELEQKLSLQLKGHREREKERDAQRDKAIAQVKQTEAEEKKKGVKLSYDDQKEREKVAFERRQKDIALGGDLESDKLQILSGILTEISHKDKTYMNLLGTVAEQLNQIAANKKEKQAKEQAALFKEMQTQSEEFFRRYNNVKQRNTTQDKVL